MLIDNVEWGSVLRGIQVYIHQDKLYACFMEGNAHSSWHVYTNNSIPANQWTHVVITKTGYNPASYAIYINGVAVSVTQAPPATSTGAAGMNNALPLNVGMNVYAGSPSSLYTGRLRNIKVYSKALSSAEITANYNSGCMTATTLTTNLVFYAKLDEGTGTTANDYSGSSLTSTITGAGWTFEGMPANSCLNSTELAQTLCYFGPTTYIAEVIEAHDFYPHGGVLPGRNFTSSISFPYGYQGQEKDAATGLTNFELRQYDPRIGRWYNPDPYGQHHSPYLAMSNNPVSFTDPDGGWDGDNQYEKYGNIYNPDAFYQSEFDNNYNHGGPLGGSINADGSFYSSDEQIYDAQINNLKYNHSNEYFLDSNGEFAGVITTYGNFNETDKNGNAIGETSRGVDDPNSIITTHGIFSVKEYSQDEIFAYYGINKKDWETTFRKTKGSGVLVQDIDMGESERNRAVWKNYGRNFNDLADFSEKAVVGIGAGAGVAMTGGVVLLTYGGVEAAGTTAIGAKSVPVVVKALGSIGCFTEGTLIWTIKGLEKIEDINTESIVYAYNVSAKKNVTEKVLTAFVREVNKLVKLEYSDEIIYTTIEHPFYIENQWIEASKMKVGDLLFLHDKTNSPLKKITVIDTIVKVYNFTVEDEHNYYVGKNKVLVHNNPCGSVLKTITSLVKSNGKMLKYAQETFQGSPALQKEANALINQLRNGNMSPGRGTKWISKDIFEARSLNGARVYFRNAGESAVEILGYSKKSNQQEVINLILKLY